MKSRNEVIIEYLDRLGFGFLFIFAASLTTSIFVNQIGYYGALLILLIRFSVQGKIEKHKTGLEIFYILLILSEIISAIFSLNSPQAFHNSFKRAILLPVVYLPVYYLRNEKRFKRIFYTFLIFAVLGMLVYLFFAYRHYIYQLYTREAKGPSIFQYVMTAGGLMSIVTIILTSFLFQKEIKLKYKMILLFGLIISVSSLISSYTRAAWVGTIAGVFFLFLLNKKWTFAAIVFVMIGTFFVFTQTTSELRIINFDEKKISFNENFVIKSGGRAHGIDKLNDNIFVANYESGISKFKFSGNQLIKIFDYNTPSPARNISVYDSLIFAQLLDSRILILKPFEDSIQILHTIIPKNFVSSFTIYKNHLILFEGENGITFINVENPSEPEFLKSINYSNNKNKVVFSGGVVIKNYLYAFLDDKKFLVIDLNDLSKISIVNEIKTEDVVSAATYNNDELIIADGITGVKIYNLKNPQNPRLILGIATKGVAKIIHELNEGFIYADYGGSIYYLPKNGASPKFLTKVKDKVTGLVKINEAFVYSYFYRSRLSSIYDPFHPSNIERINQIKVAFKIFKDYPVIGVGNIDFNEIYKKYRDAHDKMSYGHLHNNYTHILATLGTFGFIIFLILLIKILFIHIETIKMTKERSLYHNISKGLFSAFVGISISGLFEYNFGDHEIATMLWFITGTSVAIQRLMSNYFPIAKNKE